MKRLILVWSLLVLAGMPIRVLAPDSHPARLLDGVADTRVAGPSGSEAQDAMPLKVNAVLHADRPGGGPARVIAPRFDDAGSTTGGTDSADPRSRIIGTYGVVPEPPGLLLALAGLGAVGFVAFRRRPGDAP